MTKWRPPTLADQGATGTVRCACGRRVPADMMVDVTGLPSEVVSAMRTRPGMECVPGDQYRCDGCRAGAIRRGAITRRQLVEALDAPAAVREKAQRLDMDRRTRGG